MKKGSNIFSLDGQVALITGASGYLGAAMTEILAEATAHVLVNGHNPESVEQLVLRLQKKGLSAEPAIFDITSQYEIELFFQNYGNKPLNILVNNAYRGGSGSISLTEASEYTASIDITLIAAHNLVKSALPNLRSAVNQNNNASVINMTSMYAMVIPDHRIYKSSEVVNPPYYGAAKAALLQWTRYAACEFGHEGIRVNSISPGPFPSDQVQKMDSGFIDRLCEKVPMRRIGMSKEIKGPVLFLASSASSYVTGANIVVDGGWTCW